ncbi:MAG: SDR family NAD(P)-dependent oxidoreductase [Candidatus Marinimicrobia bacterium]|nr:SDR family NAD(P)-dependent oxidoreductase [Candidatus Neomarinimicrobiota bacterium]MDD5582643.1 SDR family NAD(P)-dependent oxidoreductase [Candidatus Neomarinimicrobiota bacterium]
MISAISTHSRIVVVTEATSRIGLAAIKNLIEKGTYILGIGKSVERCINVESDILKQYPTSSVHYLAAYLFLQAHIRNLSKTIEEVLTKTFGDPILDVLINNAEIFSSRFVKTQDGIESTFAVNHFSTLFSLRTFSHLTKSKNSRVITVGSGSYFHAKMHWKDLEIRYYYHGLKAYGEIKTCLCVIFSEFNRRFQQPSGIQAFIADPGLV